MKEAQRLELCVLLETPDMMELQGRQPDEAATQAVQDSFRWPMDDWWQARERSLSAALSALTAMRCCRALHTSCPAVVFRVRLGRTEGAAAAAWSAHAERAMPGQHSLSHCLVSALTWDSGRLWSIQPACRARSSWSRRS